MAVFQDTTATQKIFKLKKRIRAISGGTSSSKTISILVWLIDYAQSVRGELISVVSESFPHLFGGAMADFERIMRGQGYWSDARWVKNPRATYTFETGTKMEFMSVDTFGKAHGPRRDILFINEANNLDFLIADQLITRTRKIVFLDWNPSTEFWFYTDMLPYRDDIEFIGDGGHYPPLTYLDNEALDQETIKEIESHRHNKRWWQVYGEGMLGDVEGRIYVNWRFIDEVPHEAKLVRYGLDFGYSVDPTAIVAVYEYNGGIILDELMYLKGKSNRDIADFILNLEEQALVVADSAEPKSIDEIKSYGVAIVGAKKRKEKTGKEKTYNEWAISQVQDRKISVTKRSLNLIKEYRNYVWAKDDNGKLLDVPDGPDHALDAVKYGVVSLIKSTTPGVVVRKPTFAGYNRRA